MDISTLKPSERLIQIKHPKSGEDLGITVTVMSIDDERMKGTMRRIRDRNRSQEAKGKAIKSEEWEETTNQLVFSAMTGWEWAEGVDFKGKKPEFSRAMVFMVFTELPWFRDQIDEVLGDEKGFY